MNGAAIKTAFESIIEDTLDETLTYQIMNKAKDEVEEERTWEFLKAVDTSLTATQSDTYLTARTLPATWRETIAIFVGGDRMPYQQIGFEEREMYRDLQGYWYLDLANGNYYLCGGRGGTDTIKHFFKKTTTDLASGTSPIWPSRFHMILPYRMAKNFSAAIDQDEVTFRMAPWQEQEYRELMRDMRMWDARIKAQQAEAAARRGWSGKDGNMGMNRHDVGFY